MSDQGRVESLIAADLGSTLTHVCLIELVDGTYRLAATAESPATLYEPESDVTIGFYRALRRLEQIVRRPLLNQSDELIVPERASGAGVDLCIATSNAAPALRCVIVGISDDLSVDSARRACEASNTVVTRVISLGARMRRWDDRTVDALLKHPPDVMVLVGGVDAGPTEPLESVARVLAILYEEVQQRPMVVFAGNQEARRPISGILSPLFDLRVVDNVRPSIRVESPGELQRELADIYEKTQLTTLPGYRRLSDWCSAPVMSTTRALGFTLRFLSQRDNLPQGILGADVGGTNTFVGTTHANLYQWAIRGGYGTSFGATTFAEPEEELDLIQRWLPYDASPEQVLSSLQNIRLRPHSIPQTLEDLLLLHALSRQALIGALQSMRSQYWRGLGNNTEAPGMPPLDVLAARGGSIAHTTLDGLTALTLLDALQPTGLVRLVTDRGAIWPQLGAVATVAPLAAAQVLRYDGLHALGTAIAPVGEPRPDQTALTLEITHSSGAMDQIRVPGGTVLRVPLPADERAEIEVRPSSQLDIGLGRKGHGGRAVVQGGSLGLIVDTRGRPFSLTGDREQTRRQLQTWLGNLGCDVLNAP